MSVTYSNEKNPNAVDGVGEKVGDAIAGVTSKWSSLSGRTKKFVAGGTAVATLGGVGTGLIMSEHEEELSPADVQSGKMNFDAGDEPLRDASGKAALLNYFKDDAANEEKVLRVSLATHLPDAFRNGKEQGEFLDTVENTARSHTTELYFVTVCTSDMDGHLSCHPEMRTRTDYHHYRYDLDIEDDFVPTNGAQALAIKGYFKEFEKLTGIKVEVTENDQDAHITVANYHNSPGFYRGHLDYVNPDEISTYPEGSATKSGAALQRNIVVMNERNWGEDNNVLDAIGKPLGFENGKVNIVTLRQELKRLGMPVTQLAQMNDTYQLGGETKTSLLLPDNVIIDNGGHDTLAGSLKDDTLVAETGMCGAIDTPRNKFTNIFGEGKKYCLAEGEFEVVRAGAGDDLIIAARGGGQTIEPGAGNDRIAYFQPDIGDTTILASPGADGSNTLYLHDDNVFRGDIKAAGEGDDIRLNFSAFSGREVGSITLPDQLSGGGISNLVVVDGQGEVIFEKDVSGIKSAEAWQDSVIDPMEKAVEVNRQGKSQEEAARWRNDIRRRREDEPDLGGLSI